MEKIVFDFMEQHNMIEPGDLVIAGVSGGADSMCLLGLLLRYRNVRDFDLVAVHVNHNIRGGEANRDEAHVRDFCAAHQIPLECVHKDVPALAGAWQVSLEEAGRRVRYDAFHDVAGKFLKTGQQYRIAVAHHKGDLAETVLFHLVRGSGIRGAAGILPVNGHVIRPLLSCDRRKIVEWLLAEGISHVEDSTNQELGYSRNRLRNVVLPYLEENINSGATDNLCNFAAIMGQAFSYLEEQSRESEKKVVRRYENVMLLTEDLHKEAPILQGMIVQGLMAELLHSKKDITARHIQLVIELFEASVGAGLNLMQGLAAKRGYEGVYLYGSGADIYSVPEICEGELGKIPLDCESQIHYEVVKREKNLKFQLNNYTKYFDCDKIKGNLCIRKKKPGDYLIVSKEGGRKTLKSYLIDQKIPRELRNHIVVVADGSHVLWVVGLRDSAGCRVLDDTDNIMKVWLEDNLHCGGKDNGERP